MTALLIALVACVIAIAVLLHRNAALVDEADWWKDRHDDLYAKLTRLDDQEATALADKMYRNDGISVNFDNPEE